MSLATYLRKVRKTYRRCQTALRVRVRRPKNYAGNEKVQTKPVFFRPRHWKRSCMASFRCRVRATRNWFKHVTEGVPGFVLRRSRWHSVFQSSYPGDVSSRRTQKAASQNIIRGSRSIHRQSTSAIDDIPAFSRISRVTTISTVYTEAYTASVHLTSASILCDPHDTYPSTVTPPCNSPERTAQLTARSLNSPSINSDTQLGAGDVNDDIHDEISSRTRSNNPSKNLGAKSRFKSTHLIISAPNTTSIPQSTSVQELLELGTNDLSASASSAMSELPPMGRMFDTELPHLSPDSGTCVQSSIPSGTTVQSFEGPKSSSREAHMHIFPVDKAEDLYYKVPFMHCILFSAESNDVAEISAPTTLTHSPPCLPDAVIGQILRHVVADQPLVPIAELHREISNISPSWWSLAEDHVDSLVLSPSQNKPFGHRDTGWLKRIASHDSFDTVAYFSGQSQVPDEYQDSIFTNTLHKCRRAVIVKLTPPQGLFAGHCPTIDFQSTAPWSYIAELHLECPISKVDAYGLLMKGRLTLQTVTITIDSEEDFALPVLEPLKHLLTFKNPTLEHPLDLLTLERLHSLTIITHTNLDDIFSALTLPSLINFNLDAYAETLPGNNFPWCNLQCLSLRGHLIGQFALHTILLRCSQLTSFAWNGTRASYSLSATTTVFSDSLSNVVIDSDTDGCNDLAKFFQQNMMSVKSMTVSTICPGSVPSSLTALTVLAEISLADLNDILRNLNLEQGQFVIDSRASTLTTLATCPTLKVLSLRSRASLKSLRDCLIEAKWGKPLHSSQLVIPVCPS
ncbi:hypothetical protein HYPSUDRAFT_68397 [Hypholoma sublateritium FD-334 SS-4]|uniref:Uncharacterized protein n=1 Tax=Hypholoma sublateritium (strain FD-334 SS-4) TaxID=945553 RepID=A0A0D2NVG9_HYPSF|nr:hypothetical protein HYPSUDRAFT_68397 [Hypholoma sublateritium FD-334 SS-4]